MYIYIYKIKGLSSISVTMITLAKPQETYKRTFSFFDRHSLN